MKKIVLIAIILLFYNNSIAQGFYVGINSGYALPSGSTNLDAKPEFTNITEVNSTTINEEKIAVSLELMLDICLTKP
jgi:hypothetical protein